MVAYYEVNFPYHSVRRFKKDVDESLLVWHRDKTDRVVKVVQGNNWKIQLDDELPVSLENDMDYFIPKMTYHRLLKGNTDLIVEIIKE